MHNIVHFSSSTISCVECDDDDGADGGGSVLGGADRLKSCSPFCCLLERQEDTTSFNDTKMCRKGWLRKWTAAAEWLKKNAVLSRAAFCCVASFQRKTLLKVQPTQFFVCSATKLERKWLSKVFKKGLNLFHEERKQNCPSKWLKGTHKLTPFACQIRFVIENQSVSTH